MAKLLEAVDTKYDACAAVTGHDRRGVDGSFGKASAIEIGQNALDIPVSRWNFHADANSDVAKGVIGWFQEITLRKERDVTETVCIDAASCALSRAVGWEEHGEVIEDERHGCRDADPRVDNIASGYIQNAHALKGNPGL